MVCRPIRRLREEPFGDALLTDIVMAGDGRHRAGAPPSELDPDIKIMFITGLRRGADFDFRSAKNAKVLSKPVHLRELSAK